MGYEHNAIANKWCNEPAAMFYQWDIVYWIFAAAFLAYSVGLFASPFNIEMLTKYPLKYLYMSVNAGMKEDFDHEWDIIASTQAHFGGASFAGIGLFFLWATKQRDDFTFFHAIVISYAIVIACWGYVYWKFRDQWKPVIFGWLVTFLASLIIAIIVLVNNDKDIKQFMETEDGLKPGTALWIITIIQAVNTFNIGLSGLIPAHFKMLINMHLKDPVDASPMTLFLTRVNACAQVTLFLILLWATLLIENNTEMEYDFTFPLVAWVSSAAFLLVFWYHGSHPDFDGLQTNYHSIWAAFLFTAFGAMSFIGWYISCHDGDGK